MTERTSGSPYAEFAVFATVVLGVAVLLCLLGFWPTRRLGGDGAALAMWFAVGIAALGSVIGATPVLFARLSGRFRPQVALVSMLVRLVVVVLFTLVTALSVKLPMTPFLIWLGIAYLGLLVVDTVYATRLSACL